MPAAHPLVDRAQTEVQHQGVAPCTRAAQHDVCGLEVAVHDSLRVSGGQRVEHL